jgi:hypothetical protein
MPNLDANHGPAGCDDRRYVPEPRTLPSVHAPSASRSVVPQHEHQLERLIDRLPSGLQATVRWLRKPSSRWVRIPAGLLLIVGGLLSVLPLLGLWMLPIGLVLLAEDVPLLRTWRDRMLSWIERHRPYWLQDRTQ